MPFVANTPESLLPRTNSKLSSRTCLGVTSSGQPCRRPISPPSTPQSSRKKLSLADPAVESSYCWQHKDQAAHATPMRPSGSLGWKSGRTDTRSSVDTLTERLHLVSLEGKKRRKRHSVDHNSVHPIDEKYEHRPQQHQQTPEPKKKGFSFCCFNINLSLEDALPPSRPHPATPPQQAPQVSRPPGSSSGRRPRRSSATGTYLNLIPPILPPNVASTLMTELAKPFTEAEEPGYIYMFWLTPTSDPQPTPLQARSLLEASSRSTPPSATRKKPLLLKIGRAANVQRRMQQWSKQCGHEVELLRYYPYIPSSVQGMPRMTPHVKKVERLIHIELAGRGMRADLGTCKACGKEHREWFQVRENREAVREVDEIIRKWVDWDERLKGK